MKDNFEIEHAIKKIQNDYNNKYRESLNNFKSELCVNEKKELVEAVDFGSEVVQYKINGITEHPIFGIYFSFNQRFEY